MKMGHRRKLYVVVLLQKERMLRLLFAVLMLTLTLMAIALTTAAADGVIMQKKVTATKVVISLETPCDLVSPGAILYCLWFLITVRRRWGYGKRVVFRSHWNSRPAASKPDRGMEYERLIHYIVKNYLSIISIVYYFVYSYYINFHLINYNTQL